MQVNEKIELLRKAMVKQQFDLYIIPTADFHESEYVSEHFKSREFMSGFSGSAGTLIIGLKSAGLWCDGRYFIQAEKELKGSEIQLFKMGEENVLSSVQYLVKHCGQKARIGFDGRVMNADFVSGLKKLLADKNVLFVGDYDLVDSIWTERQPIAFQSAFLYAEKYAGKASCRKIQDIQAYMKAQHCDTHIIASLDDIAWILNMRGKDMPCFPVAFAFLILTDTKHFIFIADEELNDDLRNHFQLLRVKVLPYEQIYAFIKTLHGANILVDTAQVSEAIMQAIHSDCQILVKKNPSQLMKACKNEVEVSMSKIAHIKDGVAFCKFLFWLKKNVGKIPISEISAGEYLRTMREQQEDFIDISFESIVAYREHAAMMHYSATPTSDMNLACEGMLLVDSGGQYLQGTTDITRTIVLGKISETMKLHFTAALRGFIRLSKAHFLKGCRGMNLDILTREPLWEMGIDYQCGTGHGVGHLLNVHEGPNGIRWRMVNERDDHCVLEEGMIQSNEPGVYIENSHGIRHENELLVLAGEKNRYGQFMHFETLSFAPIDLKGIDVNLLESDELNWLNHYHKQVYEKISPFLSKEEAQWLKQECKEISTSK